MNPVSLYLGLHYLLNGIYIQFIFLGLHHLFNGIYIQFEYNLWHFIIVQVELPEHHYGKLQFS